MTTHEVFNQSAPLVDIDLFASDRALVDTVGRYAAASGHLGDGSLPERLAALGGRLGAASVLALGEQANAWPPQLRSFDRFGHRIDEIEFHPAWHALMAMLLGEGMHAATWTAQSGGGFAAPGEPVVASQVARAAGYLLFSQVENGTQCPITMTWAAVPLVARQPALRADWLPKLLSRDYDPASAPLSQRRSALLGMGMTEKQGGSDVRSNTTVARPPGSTAVDDRWGEPWLLTGHKWFMSAPMSDGFLVLARAEEPTCFLVPRWLPDGCRNGLQIQRLKDKLGNRSNASSEVEFEDAVGYRVGERGRGIATILEMASLTRLDCAIASAGIMRRALAEALNHAAQREAFGRRLVDQPLMTTVLADLALESEAAMRWVLRLAAALDARATDPLADALVRVGTPLAKYWICRRGPAFAFEAMEVLGGNGYVEEGPLARLYRELPVNSIWEGSGNVMCLDVLRALSREPDCLRALSGELAAGLGKLDVYDRFVEPLLGGLSARRDPCEARRLAGEIARAWQAALMIDGAPLEVAMAFCAGRLEAGSAAGDQAFGLLPSDVDARAIVARAMPSAGSRSIGASIR